MWYWIHDIIADRDFRAMGLLVIALLVVAALLGWLVMAQQPHRLPRADLPIVTLRAPLPQWSRALSESKGDAVDTDQLFSGIRKHGTGTPQMHL